MTKIRTKTKEEIAILREGGRRHAEIMRALVAMVKPGVDARDLDLCARKMIEEGGDKPSFLGYTPEGASRPYPSALCVSVNDEVVHGIPNETQKILKDGDIVSLDMGLIHKGMFTDMAVTVGVGNITPDLQKLIDTTKASMMAGIKMAKGGTRTGDVGNAIERVAIAGGYKVVEALCGHGVGYAVHEEPQVPNYGEEGEGTVLRPDMVIAIEPMLNMGTHEVLLDADGYTYRTADGKHSAHFEHTILITKGDPEILTV